MITDEIKRLTRSLGVYWDEKAGEPAMDVYEYGGHGDFEERTYRLCDLDSDSLLYAVLYRFWTVHTIRKDY